MVGIPGPSDEQYRKMSKTAKRFYWSIIAVGFTLIAAVWVVKIFH
jgi:hypothetical protein